MSILFNIPFFMHFYTMRWTLKTIHSHFTLIGDRTIHYKYKYTVHKREIVLEILSNKGKDIRIN